MKHKSKIYENTDSGGCQESDINGGMGTLTHENKGFKSRCH